MPAVSDSSPLILLAAIGRVELLRALYGEVAIPPEVWHEIVVRGGGRSGATDVLAMDWIVRQPLPGLEDPSARFPSLHRGEAEVITLALGLPPTVSVILDDAQARKVAIQSGLAVTGTVGVLLLAKHSGFLPLIRPSLEHIRAAGAHLSEALVARALELAGET